MKSTILFLALMIASSTSALAQTNPTFEEFLEQFPAKNFPIVIESNTTKKLDWGYYQFIPTLESMASVLSLPVVPKPIARYEVSGKVFLLYYLVCGHGSGMYQISIYNKTGEFVRTFTVADNKVEWSDLVNN